MGFLSWLLYLGGTVLVYACLCKCEELEVRFVVAVACAVGGVHWMQGGPT